MRTHSTLALALGAVGLLGLAACQDAGVNSTGSEYMPDMAHSIAYEANTYFDYYQNTWEETSVKRKYELAQPGTPVQGTVPRGYAGYYLAGGEPGTAGPTYAAEAEVMQELYGLTDKVQAKAVPINGSAPYYYVDTEADRLRAIADNQENPFPITVDGLKRGAELYNIFCAICHGENGGGNGWIYENGAYPAAPANFLQESWVDTSAGLYYHAIMYGKNVMGAYKDKMNYEERWQIIHHIRALQAKEFKKTYDENGNDLTPREALPIANSPLYVANFLESFSREPIEVESQESTAPDVVGSPKPSNQVQLGKVNPARVLDSTYRVRPGVPVEELNDGIDDAIEPDLMDEKVGTERTIRRDIR